MSELIQKTDNRATIRWKLLTGASALALMTYVSSAGAAKAEDADHPLIWLDLGGQAEQLQGASGKFTAPFMATTPEPDSYKQSIFSDNQQAPRFVFGAEGKISFQPEDSDWIFAAGIRYGRAHTKQHEHQQGAVRYGTKYGPFGSTSTGFPLYAAAFADASSRIDDKFTIVDFSAGKDVGLGRIGQGGTSVFSLGVRFAQFSGKSSVDISARPSVNSAVRPHSFFGFPHPTFHQYLMTGAAARSFKGVGPSLSWNASAPIAGNPESGELSFDWGVNAAMLFGRQKAKVSHKTEEHQLTQAKCYYSNVTYCYHYTAGYPLIYNRPHHSTRSRSIVVPNLGGFAGLSARYKDAKVSVGYRYDTFLSAMDTGIDATKKSNVTFNGPYASISIGLGN